MSLDVYLESDELNPSEAKIFIREGGSTREITRQEWDQRFPGTEPVLSAQRKPRIILEEHHA